MGRKYRFKTCRPRYRWCYNKS